MNQSQKRAETAAYYALWRLARAWIDRNRPGEHLELKSRAWRDLVNREFAG
jgi:hypothetical protein